MFIHSFVFTRAWPHSVWSVKGRSSRVMANLRYGTTSRTMTRLKANPVETSPTVLHQGSTERLTDIDQYIETVLNSCKSHINHYWSQKLRQVDRPAARALIKQLCMDNPLGFKSQAGAVAKSGTLLDYVMKEKKKHQDKLILTRVGDFYESYGIDAVMLVQYAGLNPMGGRPKAGCPIKNVQATLDSLTSAGLIVAVYEELNDVNAARGPTSKVGLKKRTLSQIVSAGTSTYVYRSFLSLINFIILLFIYYFDNEKQPNYTYYLNNNSITTLPVLSVRYIYDLCLRHEDIDFKENRPVNQH